ncbi:MAG: efflux RND transporter permease subunit [Bdellovibrionales bacterium]|nr:efflux RND transporter permease subunit [Bdellovibrionales bacterium]
MRAIIKFFAKEHLFGNLLTVLAFIVGIMALMFIRRDLFPIVDFKTTTINTVLAGASPEQVEKLILNPIEDSLREVDGIKKVLSTATESVGVTIVQLDPDARDSAKSNRDLRQAVDSIEDFPDDAEDPVVKELESSQTPVITVTVSGDLNEIELRDTADFLYDEISELKGVAKVQKLGLRDREIVVEADREKLQQLQIPLMSVVRAIQSKNWSLPAGSMINSNNNEVLIKTESQYSEPSESKNQETITEIQNTIVTSNDAGFNTQVKDIATVTQTLKEPEQLYRANGFDSIHLVVLKKQNADVLNLVEDLKSKVDSLKSEVKPGVELNYIRDFSTYLKKRIKALTSNLFLGLFLVILVLSLFLPWQVTLVVAVGIPVALLATISALYAMGESINLISLMGLIIVLGMLVDDAIVVSENIWRHIEEGDDLEASVISGAQEVFWPVFASIMTTISAFAPMMFMTGIFGEFVYQIPLAVILALVFSFIEVFLIMPSHFASWVGPFITTKLDEIKQKRKNSHTKFDGFIKKYQKLIAWSLNYRYLMLVVAVGIVGVAIALNVLFGRFILFPGEGVDYMFVQVEAQRGTSIEQMEKIIAPIEKDVEAIVGDNLKDYSTTIGIIQKDQNDPLTRRGSHYANIQLGLVPYSEREFSAQDIAKVIKDKIKMPEQVKTYNVEIAKEGPPQGRPISVDVVGKSFDDLRIIADKIKDTLKDIDGVSDIRDSFTLGKDEWQVIPKDKEVASLGLTSEMIALSVRSAFEGLEASTIRDIEGEIPIRVRLEKTKGDPLQLLSNTTVGNNMGLNIPLPQVADFKKVPTVSAIKHKNGKRVINVSAAVDLDITTSDEVNAKLKPLMPELVKDYQGYSVEFGGEAEDTQESMQSLARAFIIALLFIFFLLITTFKSLIQPILILSSIPMGMVGVIFAMLVHGRPLSFLAMLGVIALAGVIVNNGIVLIDFVNNLRKEGEDLNSSIVNAVGVRIRPIILTTTTTLCGLLPTAYGGTIEKYLGFGGGDPFIIPIALSLGWGLGFGSVLLALFFPAFIRISDDIRNFGLKLVSKVMK